MIQLTLYYDGACPLCLREVRFLSERDHRLHPTDPQLGFVDIDAPDYDPAAHGGLSYRQAMGRIHGRDAAGELIQDIAVFRRAYQLVGLGWLYAPTGWPLLGQLAEVVYSLWAGQRLRLTRRPDLDQLCALRQGCCADARQPSATAGLAQP